MLSVILLAFLESEEAKDSLEEPPNDRGVGNEDDSSCCSESESDDLSQRG